MASYTKIYKTFWTDAKVDEFTADDKYLYLYLLTNPRVSLCGCYEINIKHMAYETLLSADKVQKSIERLSKSNVVKYCKETKELLIVNWHRFNWTSSPRLINGVRKEIETVKCPEFKQYLTGLLNQTDTVSEDFDITEYGINSTDTVADAVADTASDTDPLIEKRFNQFWELYPRKQGKGDARKSWKRIKPNAELFDKIITALKNNVDNNRQWQRDNGQYIPNPSTWLNQERWEDDIGQQEDYFTRELKRIRGI